nr:putative ribonuclease H-like domain-containing protein [Tanacetum cinerariifolium]
MTGNIKLLINFVRKFLGTIRFRNDHIAAILRYGDLKWGNIAITRVYFVEGLGHNLFLVGQFCDADLEVAFRRNTCFIRDLDDVDFLKGNHSTNLYTINLYDIASASPIFLMARATPTTSWLWHQRLSHLNFDTINDLAKNDLVSGLPKFKYTKEHVCPSCEQGKIKRASHQPKPVPNLKQQLHLLHIDLCGPMRVASINGQWYVLVIVDDYSQYTWVYFLRTKDETPEVIKNFLKKISVRLQAPVIIVRTDNGTEFKNQILKEYFDSVGIIHETSAAKTPHQNGVVERRNRTLVKAARTMLIFSHAPLFLWAKAIATTFELELTYAPSTITPQRPSEHDLDVLFEPLHNEYLGSRPLEAQEPFLLLPWDLTPSPTVSAVENVSNAVFEGGLFVNPFAIPSTDSVVSFTQYVDPSNMHTFYQPYPHDYQWTKDHPLEQVIREPSRPIESMQEELYQFIRLDVWELVPSPDGIKPLTLKWLFKNKHDEENTVIRNKTHLVMRGYIQEEGIDFEDLRSSCSNGSYQDILGIRCTQRIHSVSNGCENCISAWFIEKDVYVCQPEGFIVSDYPSHVYKLKKALYGLKKASRAWYDELSTFLLQNRFSKGTIDPTLFTKRFDDDILVVQVYVDDIIFGSTDPRYATLFSDLMKSRFEMSMMGEMTFFLVL